MPHITALNIYPVKSCRGIALSNARLTETGFEHDREWLVTTPEDLGTQGDPWDTQADMLLAMLGAVSSLALLAPLQDNQIRALAARRP